MPVETELYDILKVKTDATTIEIKRAFRKLALTHHPDKGGDEEEFKRISDAYSILSDEKERQIYDQHGKDGLKNSGQVPEDIFQNLFQQGGFGNMFQNIFSNMNGGGKVQPLVYTRVATLEELCTRKIVSIKVTRDRLCECQKDAKHENCIECKGQGMKVHLQRFGHQIVQQMVECNKCGGVSKNVKSCDNCKKGVIQKTKIFKVHLTPGVTDGYAFQFPGDGNECVGKPAGDFVVQVRIKPHSIFQLFKKSLLYTRSTPLKDALCGYTLELTHPSGDNIKIQVPFANPDKPFVIKQKGMDESGDLIIKHNIVYPNLSDEQREQLKKILQLKEKFFNYKWTSQFQD